MGESKHPNRRDFLLGSAAAGILPLVGCGDEGGATSAENTAEGVIPKPVSVQYSGKKPHNLVVILTDDQRWDTLGFSGHQFLKTPALDRMGTKGVHCENAFVTTSLCSPSRASMLCGRYAHSHGVVNNLSELPPELPTYPSQLKQAGYETAYVGKWHMGGDSAAPRPHWDHWVSFLGQGHYFYPGRESRFKLRERQFNRNGEWLDVDGYVTDLVTEHAKTWLRNQEGRNPFCLVVSHKACHAPFQPAPRHRKRFQDVDVPTPQQTEDGQYYAKWVLAQRESALGVDGLYGSPENWREFYLNYHRTLLAVDDSVGEILSVLENRDLLKDTLVLFTSDNGFLQGEKGLVDKRCFYEPSIRVPLIAYGPSLTPPGHRVKEMILNVDLPSTLLDAAGIVAPDTMQGSSYLPLLQGEEIPWRRGWFYEYFFERGFPQSPTVLGFRTETHKLITYHGVWEEDELYNLEEDPMEQRNLALEDGFRNLQQRLWKRMRKAMNQLGCRLSPAWHKDPVSSTKPPP